MEAHRVNTDPGTLTGAPDNDKFNCFDDAVLEKIAHYLRGLQKLEQEASSTGDMLVLLSGSVIVQGEGFRYGWLKPVDDFWVFVPDVQADPDVE